MSWFVSSAPSKFVDPLDPALEVEFELLFGEEPPVKSGPNPERAAWQYARKYFEGIVGPSAPEEFVNAAVEDYVFFGLGAPVFFSQRGRVLARFPQTPVDFNPDEYSVVYAPDQVAAAWQVNRIKKGVFQPNLSPHVPAKYRLLNAELE